MKRWLLALLVLAAVSAAGAAQASSHFGRQAFIHNQSPSTIHVHHAR
ncbi:hypothetical protein Pla175_41490 [Pirellulimonas nuda]|uniref:Uncharacterized protein n=1 Tax=Pirellulimonas nuda TaxID=2528009 RepID=A0A518DGZ0_9BACT|nr:hypothetical protein [Pirellulimonas nuda]QDU90738.1 hypothetical protein Pla175_41490 [Pirellulimonas nuda]